jgi:hypothetical protein
MRDIPKNISIYFFDKVTKRFLFEGNSGDSDTYNKPDNCTTKTALKQKKGNIVMYDEGNDSWYYIPEKSYLVDEKGFVVREVNNPLAETEYKSVKKSLIDENPPVDMKNPRWTGTEWRDCPVPEDLAIPVFDAKKKEWKEGASKDEIEKLADSEIFNSIKQWCLDQGKCEEYYICLGIEDKTDTEYKKYKEEKDKIKQSIKEKRNIK